MRPRISDLFTDMFILKSILILFSHSNQIGDYSALKL